MSLLLCYSAMKNFNAEGQRSRGAEEDEEISVPLCLCVKISGRAIFNRFMHTFAFGCVNLI